MSTTLVLVAFFATLVLFELGLLVFVTVTCAASLLSVILLVLLQMRLNHVARLKQENARIAAKEKVKKDSAHALLLAYQLQTMAKRRGDNRTESPVPRPPAHADTDIYVQRLPPPPKTSNHEAPLASLSANNELNTESVMKSISVEFSDPDASSDSNESPDTCGADVDERTMMSTAVTEYSATMIPPLQPSETGDAMPDSIVVEEFEAEEESDGFWAGETEPTVSGPA
ncbi:hypothetical protein J8273_1928 [Carpediemonas membranifera]|uniref:Uncharacterized protein n=1 Tax=Carpediemonas membranifera TaxID=201153 RepID=A0A8J6E4F5_9EUKA|nr:hypothetical protein J8273_1928 [Carpediemonas membranifera]|eukprot:KAG9396881.1 hypothetical protein J8273_1928 [Carpediemonas membranifera]